MSFIIPSKRGIYFFEKQDIHRTIRFPRSSSAKRKKSRVTFLEDGRRNPKINGRTRPCRRYRGVSPSSNILSLSHGVDLMRSNEAFVWSLAISGHISARLAIWSSLGSRNSRHEGAISLNERPKENRACRNYQRVQFVSVLLFLRSVRCRAHVQRYFTSLSAHASPYILFHVHASLCPWNSMNRLF